MPCFLQQYSIQFYSFHGYFGINICLLRVTTILSKVRHLVSIGFVLVHRHSESHILYFIVSLLLHEDNTELQCRWYSWPGRQLRLHRGALLLLRQSSSAPVWGLIYRSEKNRSPCAFLVPSTTLSPNVTSRRGHDEMTRIRSLVCTIWQFRGWL